MDDFTINRWIKLNYDIKNCKLCDGLNIPKITESAPGYGNLTSPVMFIGQSLCTICMQTQIPFTGGSGEILDKIFQELRISKRDLFISNLVHCHPPGNRPSTRDEIANCRRFIDLEINLLDPLLIVGLGADVRNTLMPDVPFNYPMRCINGKYKGRTLVFLYHPAYYYRRGGLEGRETKEYIKNTVNYLRRWL